MKTYYFLLIYLIAFTFFLGFSQTPITDANFNQAIETCLSTNPVDGLCYDSEYGAMPYWDISNVTNMSDAFASRTDFNADISNWDVSNVTDMISMFAGAVNFDQKIGNWNVSQVIDISYMFSQFGGPNNSFNQDIGGWDVSNVTKMIGTFSSSDFNRDISNWDVSNVTDMSGMFAGSSAFNQNIGKWDVSKVINMHGMFAGLTDLILPPNVFNQDISNWDVSNVTDMRGMFTGAVDFNQDISNWDVSNVTNMGGMFSNTNFFNQNIGQWNVSNVTDMSSMFNTAESFNQNIGNWNVSNVTNMHGMFWGASSFDQDIGSWNVSNVTEMGFMFFGEALSTANYDALLSGWASLPILQSNVTFNGGLSNYCNGESSRNSLINTHGWIIIDEGLDCSAMDIDETSSTGFLIYPNPANDVINILGVKTQFDILVFNAIGKQILLKNATNHIDVSSLSNGLYFMKVLDGINTSTKKFIKY